MGHSDGHAMITNGRCAHSSIGFLDEDIAYKLARVTSIGQMAIVTGSGCTSNLPTSTDYVPSPSCLPCVPGRFAWWKHPPAGRILKPTATIQTYKRGTRYLQKLFWLSLPALWIAPLQ